MVGLPTSMVVTCRVDGSKCVGAVVERLVDQRRPACAPGGAPGCRPAADRRRGPARRRRSAWPFRLPRRPILTISPSDRRVGRLADDAGVERLAARRAAIPAPCVVPLIAGPSSSPVISRLIEPRAGGRARPGSGRRRRRRRRWRPSCRRRRGRRAACRRDLAGEGIVRSRRARSPSGTTSVWPAKQKCGPLSPPPGDRGCSTSGVPDSANGSRWQVKPSGSSAASSTSSAPASAGVTLGQRISARQRAATGSAMMRSSVAQQLVDRGLGRGSSRRPASR